MSIPQLTQLCQDIRYRLLEVTSKNGGHLASNLGVVELTVALHIVFSSPRDKIVWDVGHQSYVHKMLTGRMDRMHTIRKKGGLSGFPKIGESVHDAFTAGHASNAVSAAEGLARAFALTGNPHHVVAVVGDGALTGGMAYEGINNAGRGNHRLIVVLNDNEMSISKNVGAIARHLALKRTSRTYVTMKETVERALTKVPLVGGPVRSAISGAKTALRRTMYNSSLFESFGFVYLGPIDGHDLEALLSTLRYAKRLNRPVLVHINTVKGKGYALAEKNPSLYHGVSPFSVKTGLKAVKKTDFSAVFGQTVLAYARKHPNICAVTAAMTTGTGLEEFAAYFSPLGRFFDVGIAEAHAMTFACGLAQGGMLPVFAVYSTFFQRCYDQLLHDCAIERKHLVLAIDRAGIVGEDGETHQGLFDVALLSSIPGIVCYSPANYSQLRYALEKAFFFHDGPVAVRYPRGQEALFTHELEGDYSYFSNGGKILMVSYGRIFGEVEKAYAKNLASASKMDMLCLNRILPLSTEAVEIAVKYDSVCFVEEGYRQGGIGQHFLWEIYRRGFAGRYLHHAIEQPFLPGQTYAQGIADCKLDGEGILQAMEQACLLR